VVDQPARQHGVLDELHLLGQALLNLVECQRPGGGSELTFDFGGWSRFECLEVNGHHLDLDPSLIRNDYLDGVRNFLAALKKICGETGADYCPLPTDKPLGEALSHYLKRRTARIKHT